MRVQWVLSGLVAALTLVACGGDAAGDESEASATPDNRDTQIERHFRDNFSSTSWYGHIRGFDVDGRTVTVQTRLRNDAEGRAAAIPICSAVSTFIYANSNRDLGLSRLIVADSNGVVIVSRSDAGDTCG